MAGRRPTTQSGWRQSWKRAASATAYRCTTWSCAPLERAPLGRRSRQRSAPTRGGSSPVSTSSRSAAGGAAVLPSSSRATRRARSPAWTRRRSRSSRRGGASARRARPCSSGSARRTRCLWRTVAPTCCSAWSRCTPTRTRRPSCARRGASSGPAARSPLWTAASQHSRRWHRPSRSLRRRASPSCSTPRSTTACRARSRPTRTRRRLWRRSPRGCIRCSVETLRASWTHSLVCRAGRLTRGSPPDGCRMSSGFT
mmetsp:Transcript_49255/g.163100  ORF Transcript_49255/g.163100 Transcript_49255/m.163100 type:complete len:255 (-) Transcript_49255:102-866(-)